MSTFERRKLTCRACDTEHAIEVPLSVSADRHPRARQDLLAGTWLSWRCRSCGGTHRVGPQFTYLDLSRRCLLLHLPARALTRFQEGEQLAEGLFRRGFSPPWASPHAIVVGNGLRVRVCFGFAALREKALCAEHAIDDMRLEALKLSLMRSGIGLPTEPDRTLVLVDVDEGRLSFVCAWPGGPPPFSVARGCIDDASIGNVAATLEPRFAARSFVDVRRLFLEPEMR
jgi:hypothetical protein